MSGQFQECLDCDLRIPEKFAQQPSPKFVMIGNTERLASGTGRVDETDVTATLPHSTIPERHETLDGIASRDHGQFRHQHSMVIV